MNLFRLLALAIIAWLAWRFLRRRREGPRLPARRPPAAVPAEPMVRCAHCGVFVPATEALARDGQPFCCARHRDAETGGPGA
ncbi:MAG: PP0621 family protein [Gammaproteobacteria bacterium]|nr:PP0621 family protein [Gammaproteobacteria bacterium]